jgi:hypothetical protein
MKEITFFDSEAAGSEISRVKRNARNLEKLIEFIRKYLPHYSPDFESLNRIFKGKNPSGKIATIIAAELETKLTFSDPEGIDRRELFTEIVDKLSPIIVNIRPGDWGWYTFNRGRVEIKPYYTREIKNKYNYKLEGVNLKAYIQAVKLSQLINESPELIGSSHPIILGLKKKNPNGDPSKFQPYEIDTDHFLKRAKGN